MKSSFLLYTKKNDSCHASGLPMKVRVKARIDGVGEDYIKAFWVGLSEGDGTSGLKIQYKNKNVFFSMNVEMSFFKETELMLHAIAAVLGGSVCIVYENNKKTKAVRWVADKREHIESLLKVYEEYPPLTARYRCRREIMRQIIHKKGGWRRKEFSSAELIAFALLERKTLINNRQLFTLATYENIPHFKPWLSGFMEAESCWSSYEYVPGVSGLTKAVHSKNRFSVSQKHEKALLQFIGRYCQNAKPMVYKKTDVPDMYELVVIRRESLKVLHEHVHAYPLLGYKGTQFKEFFDSARSKKTNKINGKSIFFDIPKDSLFMKIREHPIIYVSDDNNYE